MKSHVTKLSVALVALLLSSVVIAQDEPVKRTELMRVPLETGEGKEGVVFMAEFAPGAVAPRHSHPGQEFIYVLEGSIELTPDDASKGPSGVLNQGEVAMNPANAVHTGKNVSDSGVTRVLVFMIADEGKPLAEPAK
jgi:quercetin dioxygenase-like cupin family protein